MTPMPPPPAPSAIVMTLAAQALQAHYPTSTNPKGLSKTIVVPKKDKPSVEYRAGVWPVGYKIGPKTKGKRDASRRSRANRRK